MPIDFNLQEGNQSCILRTPYIYEQIVSYRTNSKMKLKTISFRIPQADPPDMTCYLAFDTSKYPYITMEENSGVTTIGPYQILSLSTNADAELIINIDTSHPSLTNNNEFELSIPMFFSLYNALPTTTWQVVINPEEKKPFTLLYHIKVEAISSYLGVIGIDFGTTNTCISFLPAVHNDLEENIEPQLLSASEAGAIREITEMPTLFTVDKVEMVEKQAIPKISLLLSYEEKPKHPELLVRGIKRYLGTGKEQNTHRFLMGSKCYDFTTEDLVGAYLDDLQKKFIDLNHFHFGIVGNTSPCNFGRLEKSAIIRSYAKLKPPVGDAHLSLDYDEATAAAIYYTMKDIKECNTLYGYVERFGVDGIVHRNLLVYDFGGGTIDISLLQIHGSPDELRFKILGNTSIMTFGGDNITLALFKRMKAYFCHILLQGQEIETMYAQRVRPKWYPVYERLKKDIRLLERFLKNEKLSKQETQSLEDNIGKLFVTNFASFGRATFEYSDAYDLFVELWHACDESKKRLCQNETLDMCLFVDVFNLWLSKRLGINENHGLGMIQGRLQQVTITLQDDLYPFITKPLRQSMRAMRLLCMKEGQTADMYETIHEIRLAGNSSKIPLVKQLLVEEMQAEIRDENGNVSQVIPDASGILRDVDSDAKTCVSKGMTWALDINNGANNFRITIEPQNDFLPFEIGFKVPFEPWRTIFPRGTKLRAIHSYKPQNLHALRALEIFRRIGKWHKVPERISDSDTDEFNPPLYPMGRFIFSDEYTINTPASPIDSINFCYTPNREFSAHKMDKVYRFIENRDLKKENDPFSGHH